MLDAEGAAAVLADLGRAAEAGEGGEPKKAARAELALAGESSENLTPPVTRRSLASEELSAAVGEYAAAGMTRLAFDSAAAVCASSSSIAV